MLVVQLHDTYAHIAHVINDDVKSVFIGPIQIDFIYLVTGETWAITVAGSSPQYPTEFI